MISSEIQRPAAAAAAAGAPPNREHAEPSTISTGYLIDGGFVDTTGVTALLRRRVRRALLFYINNDALAPVGAGPQSEQASLAYLFGVGCRTDTMNSMAGPNLTQVFPSALYPGVIANLTNGAVLLSQLTQVPVLANSFLGIEPYLLDELIILSSAPSAEFLATFADPAVRAHVDPQWPDRLPAGLSTFDANLLNEYERWKLDRHADTIAAFFSADRR